MEQSSSLESISNDNMNIFMCGDEDYLDLKLIKKSKVSFNTGTPYINKRIGWKYYCYEGIEKEKAESIAKIIGDKIPKYDYNNVVLCTIKEKIGKSKILFEELFKIKPQNYQPVIVFISENPNITNQALKKEIIEISNKNNTAIEKVYLVKHNYHETFKRLLKIFSLYNQLGDEFTFAYQPFTILESKFSNNINIMLIGSPGCGKSTFLNKVFNEQRSLVHPGKSVTKQIIAYHHKKYPLKFFDTPGFENKANQNELMNLINKQLEQSRHKNYDLMHLMLYFINADTRPFKKEDICFLQQLLKLDIPLMFIISHCNHDNKSKDNKQQLQSILKSNNINNNWYLITPMNLIHPINGYQTLFMSLYNKFNNDYQINKVTLKPKFDNNNVEGIIDSLQSSLFFNCINNLADLINRSSNQANDAIASFTKKEFQYYLFSVITSHFDFSYDNEVSLVIELSRCYGLTITQDDAMKLLDEWDLIGIIGHMNDDEISALDGLEQTFEFVKQINGFDKIDKEMFEIIYNNASPIFNNSFQRCISYISGFKKYAIGFALLGYKAKTYCLNQSANKNSYVNMVKEGVDCYNKGIEAFRLIAEDPKMKDVPYK